MNPLLILGLVAGGALLLAKRSQTRTKFTEQPGVPGSSTKRWGPKTETASCGDYRGHTICLHQEKNPGIDHLFYFSIDGGSIQGEGMWDETTAEEARRQVDALEGPA